MEKEIQREGSTNQRRSYADDQIAENEEDLGHILRKFKENDLRTGLEIKFQNQRNPQRMDQHEKKLKEDWDKRKHVSNS